MFSENRFKEAENISSLRKQPLLNSGRKGLAKPKSNALGDVQNTIHSRPANSGITNTNAFVKSLTPGKVSASSPRPQDKNSVGKTNGQSKCETHIKSAVSESVYHDSTVNDLFETHNHILCEQAEQSNAAELFCEFKLSQSQIENLVKSFKQVNMPVLKVPSVVPCGDIEIPKKTAGARCTDRIFTVNDIFSDLVHPDVPAPVEVI